MENRRALTVGMVTLVTLIAFEAVAVTAAMPAVARALDGLPLYGFAFGGALATSVVGMVLAGGWSDRSGPGRPVAAGVALFCVGLLLAGLAPTMWALVAGRLVQGFGGGLVNVALFVVVGRAYPTSSHARVFSALSAAWVLPAIAGPGVAGLIVQYIGWRWVFLLVVLAAVPSMLLIWPRVRTAGGVAPAAGPGPAASASATSPAAPSSVAASSAAPSSAALSSVAASPAAPSSVAASSAAPSPAVASSADAGSPAAAARAVDSSVSDFSEISPHARLWWAVGTALGVLLLYVGGQEVTPLGIALLAAGLVVALACGRRLLPPGTLAAARGLPSIVLFRGLVGAAFVQTDVFIPLLLTRERGLSPALAGLTVTVGALFWSAGSWIQARQAQRLSDATRLGLGAAGIAAGVLTALAVALTPAPVAVVVAGWCLGGFGMGLASPATAALVLRYSAPAEQGANSSALQVSDALLTTTALAVGGSLFAALVAHGPAAYLAAFAIALAPALAGVLVAGRTLGRSGGTTPLVTLAGDRAGAGRG